MAFPSASIEVQGVPFTLRTVNLDRDLYYTQMPGYRALGTRHRVATIRSDRFFCLGDNSHLDQQGFAPIGRVTKGWNVVTSLFSGYGEKPDQRAIFYEGNAYLKREFPNLDYLRRAVLLK